MCLYVSLLRMMNVSCLNNGLGMATDQPYIDQVLGLETSL